MGRLFTQFKYVLLTHKVASSIIALLLVGGTVGTTLFLLTRSHPTIHTPTAVRQTVQPTPPPPPPKYYSPLTGVQVPDEVTTQQQVRGVMIENSPQARPQSGLKEAGVIFEADADGGISRFLALYQESSPSIIGPIRSVRPYFLDWLAPFNATVSHVGGSVKALNEVRNGTFKDLDEFFNGAYYWRASDRYAPHNVYTSTDKLNQLIKAKGYTPSSFTGFPRKDEAPSPTPTAGSIDIDFSYDPYNIHYDYDKATNGYFRFQSGQKHLDREEGWIEPKVVIVMKIPTSVVLEDGYRVEMQTIGSGAAYIFQDGTVTQGTWNKSSQSAQLVFNDASGSPVPLNRGQTWITVIPPDHSVTWK